MESATKAVNAAKHFSTALSPLPYGQNLSLFHLPRIPKMCERCSICDLKFEREPGYFLGAMYISYVLGVSIMAPIAALLLF